jgi:hypothetical protein
MSDGLRIVGRWRQEPPNTSQTPFVASVSTKALDLIDVPTKHKTASADEAQMRAISAFTQDVMADWAG